ncbi:GTPase-associated protein 1-related protein, partial [Streptomyces sp. NPDC048483]|uniref:GTPase-associated protein 1-related protein n=1 Tax=Streptomyces sp. NPDC048483 TaxID=3154927 RepID=UPI003443AEC0
MAFQQLYYTSCERGLSGFSGFQFNAVSAGVSAETMHEVEALTGYEPPRSLLYSDAPEDLARCPVNLCFLPTGSAATVVRVGYVGRDSARRFGNYFAHALHSTDFAADGDGGPAIELWDSPDWTGRVSQDTEIPALAGAPRRGPLTPETVHRFVAAEPHAEAQLPQLLAAVLAALEEKRSVIVVDTSTDRIAHWFAAVSYLLPPPLARELSFATYLHKPGRGRLHLIGALPETRIDIGPDDQDAFRIFDFTAGEFPADGMVPVHYLVRLLAGIGVAQARSVWSWTMAYTRGGERHQEQWHAPLAAAAAAGGVVLEPQHVRAVTAWLADAGHLGELRAAVARDLYLQQRGLDEEQLGALSAAALAGGDRDLHQELEGRLHESRMRAYMQGAGQAAAPVPFSDPAERARALEHWRELLGEADGHRQTVRLFLWAWGTELRPPREVTAPAYAALARSLLESTATRSTDPQLIAETGELLELSTAFRRALVESVAELLAGRAGQSAVFSQFPARLLHREHLRDRPELLEHYWVARAEREPEGAVDILFRILGLRVGFSTSGPCRRSRGRPPGRSSAARCASRYGRI